MHYCKACDKFFFAVGTEIIDGEITKVCPYCGEYAPIELREEE